MAGALGEGGTAGVPDAPPEADPEGAGPVGDVNAVLPNGQTGPAIPQVSSI